jgi:putative ABC transport system permease protein
MIPVNYNIRNMAVRKTTTAAAVVGIALAVLVVAVAQMLVNGVQKTMGRTADVDAAIVLRKGSTAELESSIEEPSVNLVLADQTLSQPAEGPRGVAELVVVILLDKVGSEGMSNAAIRGVKPETLAFRPAVKVIEGRAPSPGADEAMIGKALRGRFKGLDLGQSFELKKNRPVKVVGVFADDGSSNESEVWTDLDTVRTAFRREGLVSSIRVRVPPEKFDAFKASIESNRQLNVQAMRETVYFEKQSEGTSMFLKVFGIIIAFLLSVGAMIGAMITMYAAVANRQREIGTLRALGFGKGTILLSFVFESLVLALIGGALGMAVALSATLIHFSMVNWATWSEIVFSFEATPGIVFWSLFVAGVMGLIGGFLPAIRAARVSPIEAMRA